ncbi:MAG TPA: hypothetical protein VGH53_19025 [Streptosporangiaceae bacterium]
MLAHIPGAFTYDELVVLSADDADIWVEGACQTFGAPHNRYQRVHSLPSSRHVRVGMDHNVPGETPRHVLLIETGVRRALVRPAQQCRPGQLTPDPHHLPAQGRSHLRQRPEQETSGSGATATPSPTSPQSLATSPPENIPPHRSWSIEPEGQS